MCTEINSFDFETIHHEMGHIVYFMEYRKQPPIFREGGNPAFHEAIGDTIALSVMSSKHLKAIGLLGLSGTKNHGDAEMDPFEELLYNFDPQEDDLSSDYDVCDDKCSEFLMISNKFYDSSSMNSTKKFTLRSILAIFVNFNSYSNC